MDIRPRTLGELFDDACRLALADAPLLLLGNASCLVPAFTVLLVLLTQPVPPGIGQYVLPAEAALALPMTGWASGFCQQLLRRRLARPQRRQGRIVLWPALRGALEHAAARAALLCLTLPGPLLLMVSFFPDASPILRFVGFLFGLLMTAMLSLPLWIACTSLHVLLAEGAGRKGMLLRELRRDVAAAAGRAAVLVLSRIALVLFLGIQLHLLIKVLLWVADNLGGFDTSLLDLQLALFENPVYTIALLLLCWLLLAPFFESCNLLLHADIRTRQEGLDLQYRVQRVFGDSPSEPRPSGSGFFQRSLTVAALIFLLAGTSQASEAPAEMIHAIRGEIETIRAEVQNAEPYPGGQRWQGRLRRLQAKLSRLDRPESRRFRWFERAIDDFADRKKDDALRILDDLQRRLSLLEESLTPAHQPAEQASEKQAPEDVKALLRGSEGRKVERDPPRQRIEEDGREIRREEARAKKRQGEAPPAGGGTGTPVSEPAASNNDLSFLGWPLLSGLMLVVVVISLLLYLKSPRSRRTPRPEGSTGTNALAPDHDARQVLDQSPAALWRQADALAGDGRCRDAVRILYLAVLALLHRRRLIRFEPTRTNGEYVRQVRLSEQALPELRIQFEQLTHLFETAWYGERLCESSDYRACRTLAEEMQQGARTN